MLPMLTCNRDERNGYLHHQIHWNRPLILSAIGPPSRYAFPQHVELVVLNFVAGANFHDVLRKNRTLLITNNSREDGSQKIRYAHDNNIPVVTGEWLVECLKQHRKLSYEEYLIKPAGKRSLLGDKFKRKPETELASTTKRALLESVRPLNDGGSGEGKKLQQPNPSRSIPSESESKSVEGKKILKGCTVCVSKQLKACACHYLLNYLPVVRVMLVSCC